MTDAILEVVGLSKAYPLSDGSHTPALKNISFKVYPEETLGIIGKSGAGKTTLLRILRCVDPFDNGKIIVDGAEVNPKSTAVEIRKAKEKTAIHLQRSFGLWSETTLENVMRRVLALDTGDETMELPEPDDSSYDRIKDESMKLLDLVGIAHKAEQSAHTLSGGEKQRLILARQLASRPKILLLDEPLTMAAPEDKKSVLDVIKRLREELKMTLVLVSHMPEIHKELSHRLLWLDNGEIIETGGVEDIIGKFISEIEASNAPKLLEKKQPFFKLDHVSRTYYHYNLSKLFEIKDVELDIFKGEILGIVGPSGVGKTVLIRLLAGLETPNKGKVLYFSEGGEITDLTNLGLASALVRQKIAIMHQEFGLTHHARIEDIIKSRSRFKSLSKEELIEIAEELDLRESVLDFVLRLADVPQSSRKDILEDLEISEEELLEIYEALPKERLDIEEVQLILDLLGLSPDIINRKSYELSGGERIRAALAVELATKPLLLILDEPFGDLDPITAIKVSNLLKKVNSQYNTTLVIVSHDRELLSKTAHRVILIEGGEVKGDFEEARMHNI